MRWPSIRGCPPQISGVDTILFFRLSKVIVIIDVLRYGTLIDKAKFPNSIKEWDNRRKYQLHRSLDAVKRCSATASGPGCQRCNHTRSTLAKIGRSGRPHCPSYVGSLRAPAAGPYLPGCGYGPPPAASRRIIVSLTYAPTPAHPHKPTPVPGLFAGLAAISPHSLPPCRPTKSSAASSSGLARFAGARNGTCSESAERQQISWN